MSHCFGSAHLICLKTETFQGAYCHCVVTCSKTFERNCCVWMLMFFPSITVTSSMVNLHAVNKTNLGDLYFLWIFAVTSMLEENGKLVFTLGWKCEQFKRGKFAPPLHTHNIYTLGIMKKYETNVRIDRISKIKLYSLMPVHPPQSNLPLAQNKFGQSQKVNPHPTPSWVLCRYMSLSEWYD